MLANVPAISQPLGQCYNQNQEIIYFNTILILLQYQLNVRLIPKHINTMRL